MWRARRDLNPGPPALEAGVPCPDKTAGPVLELTTRNSGLGRLPVDNQLLRRQGLL